MIEFCRRYLSAGSVAQKGNFMWAVQTFGSTFDSDGRLSPSQEHYPPKLSLATPLKYVAY